MHFNSCCAEEHICHVCCVRQDVNCVRLDVRLDVSLQPPSRHRTSISAQEDNTHRVAKWQHKRWVQGRHDGLERWRLHHAEGDSFVHNPHVNKAWAGVRSSWVELAASLLATQLSVFAISAAAVFDTEFIADDGRLRVQQWAWKAAASPIASAYAHLMSLADPSQRSDTQGRKQSQGRMSHGLTDMSTDWQTKDGWLRRKDVVDDRRRLFVCRRRLVTALIVTNMRWPRGSETRRRPQ
ncbi:hypothetical protein V8C86DRAFT_1042608 [Haematococcus lacustris]